MAKFYSATTRQFYAPEIHGPRMVAVADPNWEPHGEEGEEVAPLIQQKSGAYPDDAVEITDAEYTALFDGQRGDHENGIAGKEIVPGPGGVPMLQDRPPLTDEKAWASLRVRRNLALQESDWTQGSDAPAPVAAAFKVYRQQLRDLPAQTQDPHNASFPAKPTI